MHLAIITAGGAGLFCGSCMHDNTWARALHGAGVEVSLIPLYTPIRVDEENQTSSPIFFGGINTYLNDRSAIWRTLPRFLTRWLDSPGIIQRATRGAVGNDAAELGSMTVSMLEGEQGPHRRAGEELAEYISRLKPDVVCFSNTLLSGALQTVRKRYHGPVYCVLQGDDVFLDGLIEPYRRQVMSQLVERAAGFDGYIVHSRFYRDYMSAYLSLPPEKFRELPLAIDCQKHDGQPKTRLGQPPAIGYFARICAEKGLDLLVKSVLILKNEFPEIRLRVGGYLGQQHQGYFETVCQLAKPLGAAFEYIGSPPGHAEKVSFLKSLDLFSVPARFQEPKGLYVLEALANGLPVVLPDHAAFPELIQSTGGGLLTEMENPDSLASSLRQVLLDSDLRYALAQAGYAGVRRNHNLASLAEATKRAFEKS